MNFGADTCNNFAAATSLEWLETNGRGGYASSTVCGGNTRRYHGLLVSSLNPPVDRYVLLSRLEEALIINGSRHDLSTNQFRLVVHPEGYKWLLSFNSQPHPTWTYKIGDLILERTLFMVYDQDTSVVSYRLLAVPDDARVQLEVRPLFAYRHFHSLQHENADFSATAQADSGVLRVQPLGSLPKMALHHNASEFIQQPDWYRKFEYIEEMRRGLDAYEDLYSYGYLRFDLGSAFSAVVSPDDNNPHGYILATLNDYQTCDTGTVNSLEQSERKRRADGINSVETEDLLGKQLVTAADQFIVRRANASRTVIAGYHWFEDWGRDTFISLPGLAIATKRFDVAKAILLSFAKFFNQGILPNRFPDAGQEPEYNTVDGTLWYFNAAYQYAIRSQDYSTVESEIYPHLVDSIEWHLRGTLYNIHVDDSDGLLSQGAEGAALTWMDARVNGQPVTPRRGKAVEINALWHNALSVMTQFASKFKLVKDAERYERLALRSRMSFNKIFWCEATRCLYDCIDGEHADSSIRPNQVMAVSLPFDLLPKARQRSVLRVIEEKLLTPYGLRTLAPEDPNYHSRCEGDSAARDSAYHQGTVWPWLLGPYATAYLKAFDRSTRSRRIVQSMLSKFNDHLREAGIGQVSEIFDGDAPHTPRGCIAQAWSVAELLRVILEELKL
ncbi:MAG TPA: amylo-alpha-1,6-glucosidase [Blastocatellia bacterium]|nr:amylo-alpha-1,6-glucosidase [Blastocatellia bacterium]